MLATIARIMLANSVLERFRLDFAQVQVAQIARTHRTLQHAIHPLIQAVVYFNHNVFETLFQRVVQLSRVYVTIVNGQRHVYRILIEIHVILNQRLHKIPRTGHERPVVNVMSNGQKVILRF